ncbi:hypothetical protein [Collinsella intestinalis]|uniref:Uncharacterized protein n=1 Tax=Collinsella intestinalis TaxID=147207 RepID=A0A414FX27_9ACTN|nr:hypothetical protein [Collinsella intestinalis]RHD56056.1 hypothetical protein DW787_05085 [Collinsella intestinalis]
MLSTSDAKLVKRYYLLPKAAWYSLAALFLTGGLAILLVMIDNIGLGSKGFGGLQLIAMAALMIAEGAVCIACGVVARRGLGSAHWQELEHEAIGGNANIGTNPAVAGGIGVAAAGRLVDTPDNDDLDALSAGLEIAGAAMSAYGFFDTMRRMSRAAAAVARAHGMELPGLGRTRLLVIGLPLLLLTLSFVPRFIDSTAQSSASQEVSADTIQAFNAALEPVCSYTLADDPLEHRQDSGYRVSGNITDEDGDIVASVSVETDECGAVDSVVYNADVDIARTPEENLAFVEECFARFYEAISSVDVKAERIELLDTGLVNAPVLPDQFRQAFLTGDYYTAIDTDLDDTSTLRAWALFDTEPKEEFDEYTSPRISIHLMARRS